MHRLSSLLAVSVLLLVGLLLSTSGVIAQDATPAADQHPIVGTWLLDSEPDIPDNPMEVDLVTADGGWISVDADGAVSIGAWEATGDQTADVTFWGLGTEEEGGGMFVIRASAEVAADGNSFTAEYTIEVIGPDGTTMGEGEYGP